VGADSQALPAANFRRQGPADFRACSASARGLWLFNTSKQVGEYAEKLRTRNHQRALGPPSKRGLKKPAYGATAGVSTARGRCVDGRDTARGSVSGRWRWWRSWGAIRRRTSALADAANLELRGQLFAFGIRLPRWTRGGGVRDSREARSRIVRGDNVCAGAGRRILNTSDVSLLAIFAIATAASV